MPEAALDRGIAGARFDGPPNRSTPWGRIGAVTLRHVYLLRSSWARAIELIYWPLVMLITWGMMQLHLQSVSELYRNAGGLLVGSMLLWDILLRSQLGFSVAFLEEMWARNLGHLQMSPIRTFELMLAFAIVSVFTIFFSAVPAALVAYFVFDFNILSLWPMLPLFALNLILCGWAVGLATTGIVLRSGLGAQGIAWSAIFLLMPISCIYYPVATLPGWLQPVALAIPPTYVFEAFRALIVDGEMRLDLMAWSLLINVVWLVAGYILLVICLRVARDNGAFVQQGE